MYEYVYKLVGGGEKYRKIKTDETFGSRKRVNTHL